MQTKTCRVTLKTIDCYISLPKTVQKNKQTNNKTVGSEITSNIWLPTRVFRGWPRKARPHVLLATADPGEVHRKLKVQGKTPLATLSRSGVTPVIFLFDASLNR